MVTLRTLLLENNLGQNNLDQEAHIALEALDITDYNSMLSYLPHITTTILLGLSMQIESF